MEKLLNSFKRNRKYYAVGTVLYCAVLIFAILYTAKSLDPLYTSNSAATLPLSGEWAATEDGVPTGLHTLPYKLQNKKSSVIELSITLPETEFDTTVLATSSYQTKLEVMLDGTALYTGVFTPTGRERFTPGSGRVLVPLPPGFAGKTLTLRHTRYVPDDATSIPDASLDRMQPGSLQLSGRSVLFFTMTAICSLGLLMLIVSLFYSKSKVFSSSMFYLSLFAVTAPLWVLCNSKLAQFFTGNLVLIHNVEYICFFFFPLPMWTFMLINWRLQSNFPTRLLHLLSIFFVLALTLKFFGICDFYSLVTTYHLLLAASILGVLLGAWRMRKTKLPSLRLFLCGFLVLIVLGVADLVRFYLVPNSSSFLFTVGIVFMGICVIASYLLSAQDQVKEKLAADVYKTLAYTDKLTGIRNRLSFEEHVGELSANAAKHTSIIFVNVDVNNFKSINDNYGHVAGDRVLQTIAAELCHSFKGIAACYRMGGDEFCLVALDQRLDHVESLMLALNERLCQGISSLTLSVAYGIAEYNPFLHQTLIDVFRAADNRMYDFKQRYKASHEQCEVR